MGGMPYPRMSPGHGQRMDAWPPNGRPPSADLAFMQAQHLDPNGVDFGILQPLGPSGANMLNQEFGAALCAAVNDWQLAAWTRQDQRLKATLVVTQEDPVAAVAEIERHAGVPDFVQIGLPPRRWSRSDGGVTGQSSMRRSATTCQSGCMSSPSGRTPSLAAAGPRSTWRSTM
jgi:predicted TIM-barrel fold metal-dependent hydrolase